MSLSLIIKALGLRVAVLELPNCVMKMCQETETRFVIIYYLPDLAKYRPIKIAKRIRIPTLT